jgi:hypothetical protein
VPPRDPLRPLPTSIRVTDGPRHVVDCHVLLRSDAGELERTTDVMGVAKLDVPPGRWEATCQPDCGAQTLEVKHGSTAFLLHLRPPADGGAAGPR